MKQRRNTAIDLFRGITVIVMVIVNNPGDWKYIYSPLKHPAWNGVSIADLVFPFFIIAVGMSIPFAMHKKQVNEEKSNLQILNFVLKRFFILFLLGLFLNAFPFFEWEGLRIPGVLQRIALVYLFCSMIFLFIKPTVWQAFLFVLVLVGYYILIVRIPPPDWNGEGSFVYSPVYNWAAYLDRSLLDGHLWKYTKTWDPEGVLSTVPAICNGLIGLWIGCFWIHKKYLLWVMGLLFLIMGIFVAELFPINKSIWSSSFVLVTGGLGLLFFYFLDLLDSWIGESKSFHRYFSPIFIMGRHALLVFFLIGIISRLLVLDWNGINLKNIIVDQFFRGFDPYLGSLLYSLFYLGFVYLILNIYNFFLKLIKI
jgi:predicted acyltransferase